MLRLGSGESVTELSVTDGYQNGPVMEPATGSRRLYDIVPFCSGRNPKPFRYVCLVKQETVMNSDNQARLGVAALIYLIVNAVVFGVGLILVLMTPMLAQHAFFWIPAIIVTSFGLSAPLAWFIAPSMMMRFIQARRVY